MVFNLIEEFGLIYLQIFLLIKLGYRKFIFKGSRGSRKTTLIVKWIIKDMIADPQASAMVVMETKIQNSKATMREFDKWLQIYNDKKWDGFLKQWIKVDNQIEKSYKYHNNYGWIQEVQFIGLDELAKAGGAPLPNNYFKFFFLEEPAKSTDQFGLDTEAKRERYDNINTFRLTALRHFSNAKKFEWETKKQFQKRTKNLGLTEFYALNPYNEEEPILEKFNKFLPDDQQRLEKKGYDYFINKEDKEVYMTSNYRLNKFLPKEWHEEMERIKKDNYEYWKVVGLGMTGRPINTAYSDIWHILTSYQNQKPANHVKFNNFRLAIDVGNGGKGKMSLTLLVKTFSGVWLPREEWDSQNWTYKKKWDGEQLAIEMLIKIKEWEMKYPEMQKNPRILVMDNDIYYRDIFKKAYETFISNNGKIETFLQIELFKDKYLSIYTNEERLILFHYMFASRNFQIFDDFTPKIWSQFKNVRTKENGKVIDGNDDLRQAVEIGMFDKIMETLQTDYYNGIIMDKHIKNLIEKSMK